MFARLSKCNYLALVVACFLLGIAGNANAQPETENHLSIKVGEQVSIPAEGVEKYSEGAKGIVDIRLPDDGTEFIIVGVRPGTSTLLLIKETGQKVTYTFEVKAQSSEVPKRENIRLDFYFVELRKGANYQVGVAWPTSVGVDLDFSANLTSEGITGASASISGLPLPRLDLLHNGSWARIARQASLITSNGKPAHFNSGGEVNIAIQGALAAEIRKISYGTNLEVLPRYDAESGRLELSVKAEVSSLGEGEIPARSLSTVSSVVNVGMNQAVVLAGLNAQSSGKAKSGLPWISQVPVLGALFGSHSSREEEVQNVVFIVPAILDVVSQETRTRIEEALDAYQGFDGTMPKTSLFPPAPQTPNAAR